MPRLLARLSAFLVAIGFWIVATAVLPPAVQAAQPESTVVHLSDRAAVSVPAGDYLYSDAQQPPTEGWQRASVPLLDLYAAPRNPNHALCGCFYLDTDLPGPSRAASASAVPIAWTAAYMSERFRFFINGRGRFSATTPTRRTFRCRPSSRNW
jgi:hypothetical protein